MLSFLGLAATGLPLLFSDEPWARALARLLGSFEVAGWLHRVCATLLIAVFLRPPRPHRPPADRRSATRACCGGRVRWCRSRATSRDLVAALRAGSSAAARARSSTASPTGRSSTTGRCSGAWAIIGASGLLLWFPVLFARFVPGWVFNVALLIHGEEALLAVGFIFTIHFFNGHLRPEKFPMDTSSSPAGSPWTSSQHERPAEYARDLKEGSLEALRTEPPPDLAHCGSGRVDRHDRRDDGPALVGLIHLRYART